MTTLATLLHATERYDEARELLLEVLEREEARGENSHYTYNNIAQIENEVGNYDLAVDLQEKSIALGDEILERPHALIAVRLNNLASLLADVGRMDDALERYREALAMQYELYPGGDHPDVGNTLSNLGVLYGDLEDWQRALEHLENSRDVLTAALGPDHQDLSTVYNNINLPLRRLGRSKDSESALLEAIRINDLNEGPDSLSSAIYRNNLGMYYDSVNNLPKAKAQLQRALETLREIFGNDHPYVGVSLGNLAANELSQGNFQSAEKLSREALAVSQANESPPPQTASLRYGLARALLRLDRLEESLEAYRASHDEFKTFQEPTHGQRQLAALGLVEVLLLLDRMDDAGLVAQEIQQADDTDPLEESRRDRLQIAQALLANHTGDSAEARNLYRQALEGETPDSPLLSAANEAAEPRN